MRIHVKDLSNGDNRMSTLTRAYFLWRCDNFKFKLITYVTLVWFSIR